MVVKLSSYLAFRNDVILSTLDNPQHMNYPRFSEEDANTLRTLVYQIDTYHAPCQKVRENKSGLVKPEHGVMLTRSFLEFVEGTPKKELTAQLYGDIFRVIKKYWLRPDWYRGLGRCYNELEIEIPEDISNAVEYANEKLEPFSHEKLSTFCWDTIKEHNEKRESGEWKNC